MKTALSSILITLFLLVPFGVVNQYANAQCKFSTKHCNLNMEGYKSNGQFSFAALSAGEVAELSLIFYRGLDYKLVICGERKMGDLEIKIVSSNDEVLFDNTEHEMIQDWDFTMTGTQRLRLEVKVTGYAFDGDKTKDGCVNVMIGHRNTELEDK